MQSIIFRKSPKLKWLKLYLNKNNNSYCNKKKLKIKIKIKINNSFPILKTLIYESTIKKKKLIQLILFFFFLFICSLTYT
jgi:hypothetical protein